MPERNATTTSSPPAPLLEANHHLGEPHGMIEAARVSVVAPANIELPLLYARIGQTIHSETLRGERTP